MTADTPTWMTPEVEAFCLTRFPDTTWTVFEVYQLGEALLNAVNATIQMGHSQPGNTLDYGKPWHDHLPTDLVADIIAWTSGRASLRPGAEQRVRDEIRESGWSLHATRGIAERLGVISSGAA